MPTKLQIEAWENSKGHPQYNTGRTHFKKGMVPWNKGEKYKINCKYCNKEIMVRPCELKKKFCSHSCKGKYYKNGFKPGKDHPCYIDGRYMTRRNERKDFMQTKEYHAWREAVLWKDEYTCQICGIKRGWGVKLIADHIKPYRLYKGLRISLLNGRALCVPCHNKHGAKVNQHIIKKYEKAICNSNLN